jgi:hypothetical protein
VRNTKIVKLLGTFSKNEALKFRDFVNSPYFNKNKNVTMVTDVILSFSPEYNADDFTEEGIFTKTFPGEKFDYFKIKNIISDIYQLALSFLKTRRGEEEGYENELNLLNELHERKLDTMYDQREKKVSSFLNSTPVKDETYYFLRHNLGKINTSHYKFEKTGYLFDQIQNEFDTFLDYSLIGLLRLYSKMLHNKNHGNINFNMEMFENVWEYVKDKDFDDNPSCQIYKQIILLELTRDEKEYRKLLELKEKYNQNIPPEDMYYILLIINSYAVYMLKQGNESYYKDRFLAFKEILDIKFASHNYMLFVNFISYYTSACMVSEFEWAENFAKNFQKDIVPPEEKANTVNYCKAFLAYRHKRYDEALEFFAKTNFKIYLMKIMVKSYTIRIFYEKNMFEQTLSAADSFRHYLKSEQQVAESQKTAHYEFLKHITRLAELKAEGINRKNEADLSVLKKQINRMASNPLGAKNWLVQKANELKTKK